LPAHYSGEVSDETNEAKAFSFFPMCLNVGILIASFIGGTFGSSKSFPGLAKAIPLFASYPYLLPNLLAAIFPLVAAIVAAIWLEETLPSKTDPQAEYATSEDTLAGSDDGLAKEETSLKALFTPHINTVMFSFAILSLLGGAQTALQPLLSLQSKMEVLDLGKSKLVSPCQSDRSLRLQCSCSPFRFCSEKSEHTGYTSGSWCCGCLRILDCRF
jgi:hypothetical protein